MALTPEDAASIADALAARLAPQPHPSTDDFEALKAEVHQLRTEIKDIVQAWRTASAMVGFVKWVAGVIGAAAVIWAAVTTRHYWQNGGA